MPTTNAEPPQRTFTPAERLLLAASRALNRSPRFKVPISDSVRDSYDVAALIDRYFREAHGANPQAFIAETETLTL